MTSMRCLSSMATRQVLADLFAVYSRQTGRTVSLESVGGVDATRRVQAGEPVDLVVLASEAIDTLIDSGRLIAGSKRDLARSGVAVAVRVGTPWPDLRSVKALQEAVLAAPTIGYSTGPSGTALLALFERWGIARDVQARLVQAPAGVPVGALVARGEVALGFQQRSELLHLPGIEVVGPLPEAVQIITVFSGGIGTQNTQGARASELLEFLASPHAADVVRQHGMQPARLTPGKHPI
jgi:molybdate transport system substrate-binding protein